MLESTVVRSSSIVPAKVCAPLSNESDQAQLRKPSKSTFHSDADVMGRIPCVTSNDVGISLLNVKSTFVVRFVSHVVSKVPSPYKAVVTGPVFALFVSRSVLEKEHFNAGGCTGSHVAFPLLGKEFSSIHARSCAIISSTVEVNTSSKFFDWLSNTEMHAKSSPHSSVRSSNPLYCFRLMSPRSLSDAACAGAVARSEKPRAVATIRDTYLFFIGVLSVKVEA